MDLPFLRPVFQHHQRPSKSQFARVVRAASRELVEFGLLLRPDLLKIGDQGAAAIEAILDGLIKGIGCSCRDHSRLRQKSGEIDGSLIVRILIYCCDAIDLGRMRAWLWLKAAGVLDGSGSAHIGSTVSNKAWLTRGSVLRRGWIGPAGGQVRNHASRRGAASRMARRAFGKPS